MSPIQTAVRTAIVPLVAGFVRICCTTYTVTSQHKAHERWQALDQSFDSRRGRVVNPDTRHECLQRFHATSIAYNCVSPPPVQRCPCSCSQQMTVHASLSLLPWNLNLKWRLTMLANSELETVYTGARHPHEDSTSATRATSTGIRRRSGSVASKTCPLYWLNEEAKVLLSSGQTSESSQLASTDEKGRSQIQY